MRAAFRTQTIWMIMSMFAVAGLVLAVVKLPPHL